MYVRPRMLKFSVLTTLLCLPLLSAHAEAGALEELLSRLPEGSHTGQTVGEKKEGPCTIKITLGSALTLKKDQTVPVAKVSYGDGINSLDATVWSDLDEIEGNRLRNYRNADGKFRFRHMDDETPKGAHEIQIQGNDIQMKYIYRGYTGHFPGIIQTDKTCRLDTPKSTP